MSFEEIISCKCRFCGEEAAYISMPTKARAHYKCANNLCRKGSRKRICDYGFLLSMTKRNIIEESFIYLGFCVKINHMMKLAFIINNGSLKNNESLYNRITEATSLDMVVKVMSAFRTLS